MTRKNRPNIVFIFADQMRALMKEAGDPGGTDLINAYRSDRSVEAGFGPQLIIDR